MLRALMKGIVFLVGCALIYLMIYGIDVFMILKQPIDLILAIVYGIGAFFAMKFVFRR